MLLQTQSVARRFKGIDLFNNATLEIKRNSRIGLVGRNGSGKSTLLKIIAGIEEPDEGRLIKRKDLTTGFLDQHGGLESDRTIWAEMRTIFEPVLQIEKRLRHLEKEMAAMTSENQASLLNEYNQLQEEFERQNGYGYKSEIKMVLHGFKFYEEDYDKKINHLSGGQKTRLSLAKLLLEKKDILILDEPTNHLDIETLSWLENYLNNFSGALIIVSHDRYFLDKLTTETYELSYGKLNYFKGNYSKYLELKAATIHKQQRDYEKQQKKISEMEDFINRNIAHAATSGRAQARRKQLEKIERVDKPFGDERSAFFSFTPERQSGNAVLSVDHLAIGYEKDEPPLSQNIDFDVKKGDVIALVGPNGIGKSTLLKTVIKKIAPLEGTLEYGTKVDIGYYDQEQKDLIPSNSVLNEIWDDHPLMNEENIRTFLGSFLFSGEDVDKSISSLSGGERARVSLAKLALEHNNFLILDEPTNHLDIDSKEVLENSLIDFSGTILFVSHDRYFINRLATKVVEIGSDGVTLYLGDYDYYLHKKEEMYEQKLAAIAENKERVNSEEKEEKKTTHQEERRENKRNARRLKREIKKIEEEISETEIILETVMQQMNELSVPTEAIDSENAEEISKKITELSVEYDEKESYLEELMFTWEELAEQLSQYEVD